jgi:hypothetical protein
MKGRKLVGLAVVAAFALAAIIGTSAVATHTPADKVVAAGDALTDVTEGNDQTILTARIKSSKPSDLMMHLSAECSVRTEFTRDGKVSNNTADGFARLWLEIDGKIVATQSTSAPPQDPATQPGGTDADKVTFCRRTEGYDKTDNNVACTAENPVPPLTNQCETESWFQDTKTANAFNWVRLNVGSGEHLIEVKADVVDTETASAGDTSEATATIGNRTLIVEPTKMSNDTLVLTAGTS